MIYRLIVDVGALIVVVDYVVDLQKRNQLNPTRHHTYMHQMNRKPLSHEQSMAAAAAAKDHDDSSSTTNIISKETDQQGTELSQEAMAMKQFDNDVEDWTKEQMSKNQGVYVPPTDEELLKLAGGNKMMANTGDEGLELRTVLAQRVGGWMDMDR